MMAKRLRATITITATLAGLLLSSCGALSPRPTATGDCYQNLPLAYHVVNDPHAHLAGLKLVSPTDLAKRLKQPPPPLPANDTVCAFAFTGDFAAGQVEGADPKASGKAAVVMIETKEHVVVASFVLSQLHERFRKKLLPTP